MVAATPGARRADELRGPGGRDVLEDHVQRGEPLEQGRLDPIDEPRFAVEYIHVGGGDLAMDLQDHAESSMRASAGYALRMSVTPGIRVSGCTGGIELDSVHDARRLGGGDFSGGVTSVKYRVMSGSKRDPGEAPR